MFFKLGITLRPSDVTVKRTHYRRKTTNEEMKEVNNDAMLALHTYNMIFASIRPLNSLARQEIPLKKQQLV